MEKEKSEGLILSRIIKNRGTAAFKTQPKRRRYNFS
jgi:hypothetical protein